MINESEDSDGSYMREWKQRILEIKQSAPSGELKENNSRCVCVGRTPDGVEPELFQLFGGGRRAHGFLFQAWFHPFGPCFARSGSW
jgi:hypothetical protein